MSDHGGDGEHHGEIIVVHRHGDHDDGHHGGAWKIAFADFMTAMMTFFLVMWLINSTDEQTLAQVATYFNPIKLTDREQSNRGIHDESFGGSGNETVEREKKKKEGQAFVEPKQTPGERRFQEEELFADPYDTLNKLAAQAVKAPPSSPAGMRDDGHSGGEAFRDPFDPDFRRNAFEGPVEGGDSAPKPAASGGYPKQPEPAKQENATTPPPPETPSENAEAGAGAKAGAEANAEAAGSQTQPQPPEDEQAAEGSALADLEADAGQNPGDAAETPPNADAAQHPKAESKTGEAKDTATPAAAPAAPAAAAAAANPEPNATPASAPAQETKKAEHPAGGVHKEKRAAEADAEARAIETEFKKSLRETGLLATPDISVKSTPDGILISLTDKMNFEMFAVSSAEPRPELVVVMEKLAKVIAKQQGSIIIRGHTDGRPFRSKTYDNWRLSAARAHISFYMLVRGGVLKSRVERIEGHADRNLKVPSNSRAAANRRIEILLRPTKA